MVFESRSGIDRKMAERTSAIVCFTVCVSVIYLTCITSVYTFVSIISKHNSLIRNVEDVNSELRRISILIVYLLYLPSQLFM